MNQFNIHTQLLHLFLIISSTSLFGGRTLKNDVVIIKRSKKLPVVFEYYIGDSINPYIFQRQSMQRTTANLTYENKRLGSSSNSYPVSFCTEKCRLIMTAKDKDTFTITPIKRGIVIRNTTRGFSTTIFNSTI